MAKIQPINYAPMPYYIKEVDGCEVVVPIDFDLAKTSRTNVNYIAVVRLPYRLRVGSSVVLRSKEPHFEALLRNKVEIPPTEDGRGGLRFDTPLSSHQDLYTDVCVVLRDLEQSNAISRELSTNHLSEAHFSDLNVRASHVINRILVAHELLAKSEGPAIGLMGVMEVLVRFELSAILIQSNSGPMQDEFLHILIKARTPPKVYEQRFAAMQDLLPERIAGFEDQLRRESRHVFYEYLIRARSASQSGDEVNAVIMACVALEGVHGALVRVEIERRCTDPGEKSDLIANKLLQGQGFHAMLAVTPLVFMDAAERPSHDLIERCQKAVEIRNDIMHALTKKGQYKVRKHSETVLRAACDALLTGFACFEKALSLREST